MLRDVLVACLFGVLEGVTEWLPISSTGHLILLEDILSFPAREEVFDLFEVLIQLGAILAVAVLYWHPQNPGGAAGHLCPLGQGGTGSHPLRAGGAAA